MEQNIKSTFMECTYYGTMYPINHGGAIVKTAEPKKLALIRVLQIYNKYSDCNHPLTQQDIANYLMRDYGIDIERKAISRNISLLREAGIDIVSERQGSYIGERDFEEPELHMLIDGVLCSKYITAKHSKDLIEKLCGLSNDYFKSHVNNVYSVNERSKSDNQELFLNIELIDSAIEQKCQIAFDYNKYGMDKKLHKSKEHVVSPYQLILHNQRYYLMALSERWKNIGYYRLDHITNMEIIEDSKLTNIRSVEGFENGIDYKDLSASRPYMFADKAIKVEFVADELMIDQIIDWFGYDIKISKVKEGKIKVELKVSPGAMEYWAMQYINYVEITKPESLRKVVKENLERGLEKYKS